MCGLVLVAAAAPPARAAGSLQLIPDPIGLGINFVAMLLLIYPVNRWLLQPLVAVLQERESRTHGANQGAEALAAEAAQARQIIADRTQEARAEAQASRAALLGEADQEERSVIGSAREDAGRQVESVRESLQAELRAAMSDPAQVKTAASGFLPLGTRPSRVADTPRRMAERRAVCVAHHTIGHGV